MHGVRRLTVARREGVSVRSARRGLWRHAVLIVTTGVLSAVLAGPAPSGAAELPVGVSGDNLETTIPALLGESCSVGQLGFGYPPPANVVTTNCGGTTATSGALTPPAEIAGITVQRSHVTTSSLGDYAVNNVLLDWDTRFLPDNARIVRAWTNIRVTGVDRSDGRSLVAEWYPRSNGGASGADWALNPVTTDAIAGIPLSSVSSGSLLRLEFADADEHIDVLNARSGVRLHISGGSPSGLNRVQFDVANEDLGLRVEYVLALRQCVATPLDAGQHHTFAVRADGPTRSWGSNEHGQLGAPSSQQRSSSDVALPQRVVTVASGAEHTLVVGDDGKIAAFGKNESGQLGIGAAGPDAVAPIPLRDLDHVIAVAAGVRHSLALKDDGTVWAWGSNAAGQLGTGSTVDSAIPVRVGAISDATAIAAGDFHSMALSTSGAVYAWGDNSQGQLGDGTTTARLSPVTAIASGTSSIAAGSNFSVASSGTGAVRAWGNNDAGQLGDGTVTQRLTPQVVPNLSNVTRLAAGATHVLALDTARHVFSWGDNAAGQLGVGVAGAPRRTPQQIVGLTGVRWVEAGSHQSFAGFTPGSVAAWGYNGDGQLGTSDTTDRSSPTTVTGLDGLSRSC